MRLKFHRPFPSSVVLSTSLFRPIILPLASVFILIFLPNNLFHSMFCRICWPSLFFSSVYRLIFQFIGTSRQTSFHNQLPSSSSLKVLPSAANSPCRCACSPQICPTTRRSSASIERSTWRAPRGWRGAASRGAGGTPAWSRRRLGLSPARPTSTPWPSPPPICRSLKRVRWASRWRSPAWKAGCPGRSCPPVPRVPWGTVAAWRGRPCWAGSCSRSRWCSC